MTDPLRQGRPYRRAAAKLRAQRLPCWLCGGDIDYRAPARTRWSFTVDHEIPLSKGGHLHDPANLRPAHYSCNSSRGNRPARWRGQGSQQAGGHSSQAQGQACGELRTSRSWWGGG